MRTKFDNFFVKLIKIRQISINTKCQFTLVPLLRILKSLKVKSLKVLSSKRRRDRTCPLLERDSNSKDFVKNIWHKSHNPWFNWFLPYYLHFTWNWAFRFFSPKMISRIKWEAENSFHIFWLFWKVQNRNTRQ